MKQLTLSFLLMLLPLLASAETVEINGIRYNLIKKTMIAQVIYLPCIDDIVIPESISYEGELYHVTTIKSGSNECYGYLSSITIPSSIQKIEQNAFTSGFNAIIIDDLEAWCNIIFEESVPFSSHPVSNHIFLKDDEIIDLVIPSNVTAIKDFTFKRAKNIKKLELHDKVISIGKEAFSGCSGLTSLVIPNSVTSIESSAFSDCTGLTSISFPNSVTSLSGFSGCTGLTSITVPNTVMNLGGFSDCTGLTSITIPNSVTSLSGFNGCTGLTSITIPNSVMNIGGFFGCTNLKSVTIGSGVKNIYSYAFANCQDLTDVYCLAENVPSTDAYAFNDSYIEYATLHVPASAINAYKTTAPWSGFGTFVAIEGSDTPETKKCATPTITFDNGKIKFNCETEGVEYISEITTADTKKYYDSEITPTYKYKVSVYATKTGYENSDTATAEITATGKFGDMNHDNKITVADAVIIIDKVMKNEE